MITLLENKQNLISDDLMKLCCIQNINGVHLFPLKSIQIDNVAKKSTWYNQKKDQHEVYFYHKKGKKYNIRLTSLALDTG